MAFNYDLMPKSELVALLRQRDLGGQDILAIEIKLQKLDEEKIKLLRRKQELPNVSVLSELEKTILSNGLDVEISKLDAEISELIALKTNLAAP